MTRSPPTPREDARIQRSREALRAALLELVEHRPFEGITIREITDCARIGHATFYRHYPSKGALLDDVAAAQIRALARLSLPNAPTRTVNEACLATVQHVEQHRSLWNALLTGGAASAVREGFILVAREIHNGQRYSAKGIPADLAGRFAASALVEVLTWWLESGEAVSASEAAQLLDRLMAVPLVGHAYSTGSEGTD